MRILDINPRNPEPEIINEAAKVVAGGGILIYPTDTCYGIGGDATSTQAIHKIQQLKSREAHKPFSVIVRDLPMIHKYAILDETGEAVLRHYLPGQYTFALLTKNFNQWPYNSIWVRMPNYAVTQALAEALPMPYITTSANISGEPPAYSIEELEQSLLSDEGLTVVPDLILNAGPIPHNPPSTIVNLTVWPPKIIRQGGVTFTWPDQPPVD